jgi:hypothetical protein
MERENLKKLIDVTRPQAVRAEMYSDPLMRKMNKVRQDANDGYHKDLLALYDDRSLTAGELRLGADKAWARYEKTMEKLRPLQERFEREVSIPSMVSSGVLKKSALAAISGRRRRTAATRAKA